MMYDSSKYSNFLANSIDGRIRSDHSGRKPFRTMEKYQKVNEQIEDFLSTFKVSSRRAA